MNLRWLWMDHFPAGLDLTPVERSRIKKIAEAHRKREPRFYGANRLYVRAFTPIMIVSILLIAAGQIWRQHLPDFAPIAYVFILFPGMARAIHRSRRPFIRKALIDCGHPVCMECGYILRGVNSPQCPECGADRLKAQQRPLDTAEKNNPSVVQLLIRLGYSVCTNCGAMWFDEADLKLNCPTCGFKRQKREPGNPNSSN